MTAAGFLIIIILILIAITFARRKDYMEGFEDWPIPTPEELGTPTPPSIMKIEERVANGEITAPPVAAPTPTKSDDYTNNLYGDYGPSKYGAGGIQPGAFGGAYGGMYPGGMYPGGMYPGGMYPGGMYPGVYGGGMYPGAYGGYNPLSFGGNSSGSSSIGGFGPAAGPNLVTPAMTRGSAAMQSELAPAAVSMPSAVTASQMAPAAVAAAPSVARASIAGRETRAKTLAEEADIKGFDWAGAAAHAATAFEPTQTVESAPMMTMAAAEGPFQTVAAEDVKRRSIYTPNVTATTAVSLPSASTSAPSAFDNIQQQKLMQAAFGSIAGTGLQLPQQSRRSAIVDGGVPMDVGMIAGSTNMSGMGGMSGMSGMSGMNSIGGGLSGMDLGKLAGMFGIGTAGPVIDASGNVVLTPYETREVPTQVFASSTSSVRGSKFQPGSGLTDSKSTQTIVDTAPGQVAVAPSVVQSVGNALAGAINPSAGVNTATGMSSMSA